MVRGFIWLFLNLRWRLKGSEVDFTQRWVVNDNWTYTADLSPFVGQTPRSADTTHQGNEKTLLVFYGIDTIANIVRPQKKIVHPIHFPLTKSIISIILLDGRGSSHRMG